MAKRAFTPPREREKPGFFYGYIIVIASFVIMVIMYGTQYSFGVFFKPVLNEFGWTRATTSGAYSLFMFVQGISCIVAGKLSDRFNPRLVVTAGGCLLGLGYLLIFQISTIWQLYLFYSVLAGIGMGNYVPMLSLVARWFTKSRGLMTGIVVAGIGAGIIIMPPVANQLISSYNWRVSYIIIGCVALITIAIAAQFLKPYPSQTGLPTNSVDEGKTGNLDSGAQGFSLQEAMRTRQCWILCAVFFIFMFCLQSVMVHIVPHITDKGISAIIAATVLSTIGSLSIVGKVGMGSASDRSGSKLSLAITLVLMSAILFWLLAAKEPWMFYLFAVVFGFSYGGISLQSPIVVETFGLKAHGAILGFLVFCGTTGGGVGPLVVGRIFDITGSYQLAFLGCAVLCVISLILLLSLRLPHKGNLAQGPQKMNA